MNQDFEEPDDWKGLAWDKVIEARNDERRKTIEECAKLVNGFDCHLAGYPSEQAQDYYECGVADACNMLEDRILALASSIPSEKRE